MTDDSMRDVVIVGAGPVGLVLALALGRAGVDVLLLEREDQLPTEGRATTVHASTLELLDELGVAAEAISQGIPARTLQYRDYVSGERAIFDFAVLSSLTKFPFRLQLEQNQLCRIVLDALAQYPNVEVRFGSEAMKVDESGEEVAVEFSHAGQTSTAVGRYVVGADGSRSLVRQETGIGFDGSTYPFTMLTLSTFADMTKIVEGVSPVTYVFDSQQAMAFLRIKDHWRISLNTTAEMPEDREELTDAIVEMASTGLGYSFDRQSDVKSINIHRIHQRVAERFGTDRVLLVGDAAHLNSPTGGMGMNSGIHDGCELFPSLISGLNGGHSGSLFDEYKAKRKHVATDVVGFASDKSTKDMFASAEERLQRIEELRAVASKEATAREFLRGSTLIDHAPHRSVLAVR